MTCVANISILLSILFLVTLSSGELLCKYPEVIDECPSNCLNQYCPKDELHDKTPCEQPKVCPPQACKCHFDYRRADNGTCVPTRECPPFECSRVNEEYEPCPPLCPSDDCRDASPTGECPYPMLFVIECSPSCRCIKNHWRKDGVCVPYENCRQLETFLPSLPVGWSW